jgi:hypothetical protein|nr:MAG TPA: hypothetical protein [Caudoviricetes sp.]
MKNYKDFAKMYIGESDIASLTVRSGSTVAALDFGQDNEYQAYIVDGNTAIPDHYHLVLDLKHWINIYDDRELAFSASADHIRVYRAGEMGCIIQLDGNADVKNLVTVDELLFKLEQAANK